jgi:hypothetical protein
LEVADGSTRAGSDLTEPPFNAALHRLSAFWRGREYAVPAMKRRLQMAALGQAILRDDSLVADSSIAFA